MNKYIRNIVEAFDFNGVRNNKNKAIVSNIKDFIINQLVDKIKNEIQPDDDIWNKFKDSPIYPVKSKEELRLLIENTIKLYGEDCSLNWINTYNITDMSELFYNLDPHNIDISMWDVSNVTNMKSMFEYCHNFNSNLSKWNVSNVTNMRHMFEYCWNFNSDLSKWNVSNVKNMEFMFSGCHNFNSDLSNWDVSKVAGLQYMFHNCENFNSDLSKWNIYPFLRTIDNMFKGCKKFNSDLSNWDVYVKYMSNVFDNCDSLKKIPDWYKK